MSEYLTEENLAIVYESLLIIIDHAHELKAAKLKAKADKEDSDEEETKETDAGDSDQEKEPMSKPKRGVAKSPAKRKAAEGKPPSIKKKDEDK